MFQYAALYKLAKDNHTDFYFQDPKWFEGCEDEIKKLFGDGIGYLPYVAIHLRVGVNPTNLEEPAYLENPFYYPLAKSGYYINAINLFPDRKFLVFSDDILFAKKYFEGDKFAFDESENDIDSFNQMASCSDFIIANSSFSWWAATLNFGNIFSPIVEARTGWNNVEFVPGNWPRIADSSKCNCRLNDLHIIP
jgi:hypothetical protein